ncbi:MAG: FeoA family protein [Desulfobacteraceae bacterium]|jgi:ferrous iron transport protein A
MKSLTKLKQDGSGDIKTITGDSRFISRITSIGQSVGSSVRVMRNGFGMPMLLYAHDTLIAVSKKEAKKIFIHGEEVRV